MKRKREIIEKLREVQSQKLRENPYLVACEEIPLVKPIITVRRLKELEILAYFEGFRHALKWVLEDNT